MAEQRALLGLANDAQIRHGHSRWLVTSHKQAPREKTINFHVCYCCYIIRINDQTRTYCISRYQHVSLVIINYIEMFFFSICTSHKKVNVKPLIRIIQAFCRYLSDISIIILWKYIYFAKKKRWKIASYMATLTFGNDPGRRFPKVPSSLQYPPSIALAVV